jgi:hypothetical protein
MNETHLEQKWAAEQQAILQKQQAEEVSSNILPPMTKNLKRLLTLLGVGIPMLVVTCFIGSRCFPKLGVGTPEEIQRYEEAQQAAKEKDKQEMAEWHRERQERMDTEWILGNMKAAAGTANDRRDFQKWQDENMRADGSWK